jgi:hypothetical protein
MFRISQRIEKFPALYKTRWLTAFRKTSRQWMLHWAAWFQSLGSSDFTQVTYILHFLKTESLNPFLTSSIRATFIALLTFVATSNNNVLYCVNCVNTGTYSNYHRVLNWIITNTRTVVTRCMCTSKLTHSFFNNTNKARKFQHCTVTPYFKFCSKFSFTWKRWVHVCLINLSELNIDHPRSTASIVHLFTRIIHSGA